MNEDLYSALRAIGHSITAPHAGNDATGAHVECLTEAVMGLTASQMAIASAIENLAEAVREHGG